MASPTPPPGGIPRSTVGASFVMPIVNGAMRLWPAVGAMQLALGYEEKLHVSILLTLFSLHVLIEVLDKYADLPRDRRKRWLTPTILFACPFLITVVVTTGTCGIAALLRLLAVPALAIVHAIPLIPVYSWQKRKVELVKLKYFLGPFKSLFGATCIGLMDTTAIVKHVCDTNTNGCLSLPFGRLQIQVLLYTILYDFLWETIADLRDLDEDSRNGVITLATRFGRKRTLILLVVSTITGDLCITAWRHVGIHTAVESICRSVSTWSLLSTLAVSKPRSATISWSFGTLIALFPVYLACQPLMHGVKDDLSAL